MSHLPQNIFTSGARAHLVGIGGIGMSALAAWLLSRGVSVSGSDAVDSDILHSFRRKGIRVTIEPGGASLPKDVTLLVYSDAVPPEDPARQAAISQGLPTLSYAAALGMLAHGYETIAVSGSHGKSTTTALVAQLLIAGKEDPTVVIGTKVPGFSQGNFRQGGSSLFVVEADEYRNHCLAFTPQVGVITTTDYDHVDAFPTLDAYRAVYHHFADRLLPEGQLVLRASDPETPRLSKRVGVQRCLFFDLEDEPGAVHMRNSAERWTASRPIVRQGTQTFSVFRDGDVLGVFHLSLPGKHLVLNLLAACAATSSWKLPVSILQETCASFQGTWRRFERVGTMNGADIISDYGHHPTELSALLDATMQWYPSKRIIFAFQPHQKARTRAFRDAFLRVLSLPKPHVLVLSEVYDVVGREEVGDVTTAQDWVEPLRAHGTQVIFAPTLDDMEQELRQIATTGDVVLVVGAGTIDAVARRLADVKGRNR